MPKLIADQELDSIADSLKNYPSGARIEDISQAMHDNYTTRTLQRRLSSLVGQNRISIRGKGAATRYFPNSSNLSRIMEKPAPYVPGSIHLSDASKSIQEIIHKPLHARKAVGYNRQFLDSYIPGQTWFLDAEQRSYLHSLNEGRAGEMPAGTYARKIYSRLLIDLSWNSSRLEGNTYSLLETDRLLTLGKTAEGKALADAIMLLNHKAAIDMLVEDAAEVDFNRYTMLNLHALLSHDLLENPAAVGRLRQMPVGIGGTVYQPLDVPQIIDECFQQILETAAAIPDPFEQAFFVMVHLPYLQPFEDVNKRTSRLAANIPLIKQNYCPLSFVNVSERVYVDGMLAVYELNRIEVLRDVFLYAYGHSCSRYSMVAREVGEPDHFRVQYRQLIKFIASSVVRGKMDKESAARYIHSKAAAEVTEFEQPKLVELVETDLMAMHEGNLAVYQLRPSEFYAWQKTWH